MVATLSAIDAVLAAATLLLPVRETLGPDGRPNNRGRFVEAIQASTGGSAGDFWCDDFVFYCGHGVLGAAWPLPQTGSCQASLDAVRAKGIEHRTPARGDQFFLLDATGHAHHTGLVLAINLVGSWESIEGNARDQSSASSDGDGVHRCTRGQDGLSYTFGRWADAA